MVPFRATRCLPLAALLSALVVVAVTEDEADWMPECSEVDRMRFSLLQTGPPATRVVDTATGIHIDLPVFPPASVQGDSGRARQRSYVALGFATVLTVVLVGAGLSSMGEKAMQLEEPGEAFAESAPTKVEVGDKAEGEEEKPNVLTVVLVALGHGCCAALLTLSNRITVAVFHPAEHSASPSNRYLWVFVTIQFTVVALIVKLAAVLGLVQCEPLERRRAWLFFPAAGLFMLAVVASNAVLGSAGVNFFVVVRSLTPIPCSMLEMYVYSDPAPPLGAMVALVITLCGAVGYTFLTNGFVLASLPWGAILLLSMPLDALLFKHAISASKLSAWGLVYYTHAIAAMPAVLFAIVFEVPSISALRGAAEALATPAARAAVPTACTLAFLAGFFALKTRYYVTATAFMVLSAANKYVTTLLNNLFLQQEGALPILCVVASLTGVMLWQYSVAMKAVNVRKDGRSAWDKAGMLPHCLTMALIVWAGFIQVAQMPI